MQGTQTFRSPDGLGAVRHRFARGTFRGPDDPAWTAWAGDWRKPQWKASFARDTPATLVAAFTTSLISTEPLHRTVKDVPLDFRHRLNTAAATAQQPPARPPATPPPTGPAPRRTQ